MSTFIFSCVILLTFKTFAGRKG